MSEDDQPEEEHPGYDNKILTSARNGELIVWDLNKLGPSKYGE
jgi:WD repeat-containing protein 24